MTASDDSGNEIYNLELGSLRDEWKEARATIDRFDKLSVDIRKYGFSMIALIISSSTIIFDAAQIKNPIPITIVPLVVAILILGVYLADSYYQVLLLSTILHSRQLENVHKEILSHRIKQQTYFGWNLTNYIEDKVQKSRAYLYTILIYVLFLIISFVMGLFSLLYFQSNSREYSVTPYILVLSGGFLFGILFLFFTGRAISRLLKEMQETEMIDNRFVIRKVFSSEEIAEATKRLAGRVYSTYQDTHFKILTLGIGGLYFANNLISELRKKGMINVEFISAFSERTGDQVNIEPPQKTDVAGENILIVDDLISTGMTIQTAIETCKSLEALSVRTCALLDAPNKRRRPAAQLDIDFVGLTSKEKKRFFVGCGLDGGKKMSEEARDRVRLLPYIGVIVAPLDDEAAPTQEDFVD
jgi:hypoxanthine phosphoribosyltransferase